MNENTVFQNPNVVEQPPQNIPATPVSPVSEPPPSYPIVPPEAGNSLGGNSIFSLRTIVKLLLGLAVVVVLLSVFIFLVLPRFNKNKNEKVTLTYWGLWEDSRIMSPLISEFQKNYPNITVEYSKQDIKQYRERLVTRIKNGTGPDIFRFHNSWYPMLSGVLLPLPKDVITKEEFKQSYYAVSQGDLVKNGAIYGIPLSIDTLSLYINKDLLQKVGATPPTNWIDFMNTAKTLTVKDEEGKIQTAGAAMGTFSNIAHAPDILSLLLLQNGANISNLTATTKSASDALVFYTSFAKGEGSVWDDTLENSVMAFAKGNLGMMFGYSWDYFTIKALNPDLNLQIVPVPQLPGQNINLASYWSEGVSVKSKYQKETLLFLQFLAQKETVEKLYTEQAKSRLFGAPYGRVDLGEALKDNPTVYPFIKQAKTAKSSFFVDSTYDNGLNSQTNTYLGNAVNSVLNNTSPQTAVETLAKGVEQVLGQYGQ